MLVTILCALLIATAVTAVVLWSSYRQDEEPPQVERLDTEREPHIYFGTAGGGLQSYSLRTTQVKPVWGNKNDYVTGVTYDSVQDTIYWATETYIYKKNRTEDQVDRVLDMLGPPWNEKCNQVVVMCIIICSLVRFATLPINYYYNDVGISHSFSPLFSSGGIPYALDLD